MPRDLGDINSHLLLELHRRIFVRHIWKRFRRERQWEEGIVKLDATRKVFKVTIAIVVHDE